MRIRLLISAANGGSSASALEGVAASAVSVAGAIVGRCRSPSVCVCVCVFGQLSLCSIGISFCPVFIDGCANPVTRQSVSWRISSAARESPRSLLVRTDAAGGQQAVRMRWRVNGGQRQRTTSSNIWMKSAVSAATTALANRLRASPILLPDLVRLLQLNWRRIPLTRRHAIGACTLLLGEFEWIDWNTKSMRSPAYSNTRGGFTCSDVTGGCVLSTLTFQRLADNYHFTPSVTFHDLI